MAALSTYTTTAISCPGKALSTTHKLIWHPTRGQVRWGSLVMVLRRSNWIENGIELWGPIRFAFTVAMGLPDGILMWNFDAILTPLWHSCSPALLFILLKNTPPGQAVNYSGDEVRRRCVVISKHIEPLLIVFVSSSHYKQYLLWQSVGQCCGAVLQPVVLGCSQLPGLTG